MEEGILLGILAGFSVYDIKTKQVPLLAVTVFGVLVLGYKLFIQAGVLSMAAGLLPGVVFLVLAYVTGESVGYGDGFILCVLGLFCGLKEVVAVLGTALLLVAVLSAVLLVMKRVGRKTELPFLPFLCLGYLGSLLW